MSQVGRRADQDDITREVRRWRNAPQCGHTRDEQERAELEELVGQWWRRIRGRPLRPAMCHSTARMPHVITPCRCRAPFHGA